MRKLLELNLRVGVPVLLFLAVFNLFFAVVEPGRWWNWAAVGLCLFAAAFNVWVRNKVEGLDR